jgi:hypothetical protein
MHLRLANADDPPHLAAILFRAFANDALITGLCYPDTPPNRAWWAQRIAAQIADVAGLTRCWVVVLDDGDLRDGTDGEAGQVVGWAKWLVHRPVAAADGSATTRLGAVDPDAAPSLDMNLEACRKLADAQHRMRQRVLGTDDEDGLRPHWCE